MKDWIKKIIDGEIKIKGGSDRFLIWNNEHWNKHHLLVNNNEQKECCQLRQLETEKYGSEMERWWIYVNHPEEALMYVAEVGECEEKFPENLKCDNENCLKEAKSFNERKEKAFVSKKTYEFAYKLKFLYKFKNPFSLSELKKYKSYNQKPFRPSRSSGKRLVKISSYPELVKDIIAGKIL